jgi:hypothetical protein
MKQIYLALFLATTLYAGRVEKECTEKTLFYDYLAMDTSLNSINNTGTYQNFKSQKVRMREGGAYDVIWVIDSVSVCDSCENFTVTFHLVGDFFLDKYIPKDTLIVKFFKFDITAKNCRIVYPRIPFVLFPRNVMSLILNRGISKDSIRNIEDLEKLLN